MVDTLSLNYLPETGGWPDQIPRLEDGWWPTGGAVDPANDSGLMNWQAQLLTQRTSFLKAALGGIGGVAEEAADLNALSRSGIFRFAKNAGSNPAGGVTGAVMHVESGVGTAWQMAVSANGRSFTRVRVGATPTWGGWRELLDNTGGHSLSGNMKVSSNLLVQAPDNANNAAVTLNDHTGLRRGLFYWAQDGKLRINVYDATGDLQKTLDLDDTGLNLSGSTVWHDGDAPKAFSASGYQKLPSGLIIQWVSGTTSTAPDAISFSFPIAFPNSCFWAMAADGAWNGTLAASQVVSVIGANQSTFNVSGRNLSDQALVATAFRLIALGN